MRANQDSNDSAAAITSASPPASAPSVAAVVLNWNGREPLLRTIGALYESARPFEHVFLVDNGSSDGSVEAVRSSFSAVVSLVQAQNLGPGQGRNVGIERALASGVDYVFSVDNDIEVYPDTLGRLLETARQRPDAGVIGPMMYFRDRPGVIQNVGGQVRFRQNLVSPIGWLQHDEGQFSVAFDVDMVGSAAMLTPRWVFERVGAFDSGYIGYGLEDTDFCTKVRRAGWKIVCDPAAKVRHDFRFNHKYTYRRKYLEARNALFYLRKYGRLVDWAKYLFFSIGGLPYAFIREAFRGNLDGVRGKAEALVDALVRRDERAIEVFRAPD